MKLKTMQNKFSNKQIDQSEVSKQTLRIFGFALIFALLLLPDLALAEPWDDAANKVLQIFTGGLARTIAVIAVVALGIAALVGKLSWQWAIYIIIGIVLIFGAPAIVDYIISATGSS